MNIVYLLQHSYEKPQGHDEIKTIGIFRSKEAAEEAISQLKDLSGFCEHPINCFQLNEYTLGKVWWAEGFGID